MKIIVTGAKGFVGSALTKALAAAGHSVLPWTRAQADLTKPFDLPAADIVYHIAANAKVFVAKKDPCLDLSANAMGTLNTLQACEHANIRTFVYASSALVYENCWNPDENATTGHNNYGGAYGISKLAGELYTRNWAAQNPERRYAIFRISNPYGPGMRKNIIFDALEQFQNTNTSQIKLRAAANAATDFLHIQDVVSAMLMTLKPDFQGVFNLSSNYAATTAEIIAILSKLLNRTPEIVYGENNMQIKIQNTKLRAAGWTPTYDLETGLRQTLQLNKTEQQTTPPPIE